MIGERNSTTQSGRRVGRRRTTKRDAEFFRRMGRIGGELIKEKYGSEYFRRIATPKNQTLNCVICGRVTPRKTNNQMYCPRCSREQDNYVNLKSFKRRYRSNPEWRKKHREYARRWKAKYGRKEVP